MPLSDLIQEPDPPRRPAPGMPLLQRCAACGVVFMEPPHRLVPGTICIKCFEHAVGCVDDQLFLDDSEPKE